jgi:hypothetical protein
MFPVSITYIEKEKKIRMRQSPLPNAFLSDPRNNLLPGDPDSASKFFLWLYYTNK